MKIVHVIGALIAGGAERFVVSLSARLRRAGADVSVWVLSARRDGAAKQMEAALQAADVPWSAGPSVRVGFRTVLWFRAQCARETPRILHLHTSNTERMNCLARLMPIAINGGQPIIVRTVHSTTLPEPWVDRLSYRLNKARCSIACGGAVAETHANFIPGPLLTIPNGVSFDVPTQSTESRRMARVQLGLDPDRFQVVHAGRMSGASLANSPKAHDVLIRAWQQSGLGRSGALLHLLGDGNLRAALELQTRSDPSIRFLGVRDDLITWLEAADCFVLPSRHEGLSIVAIEAIGIGLPCLFSDVPSLRELAPPNALWTEVNDAASLAQQLLRAREHSHAFGEADVKEFRERYSIERTARKYLDVYRQYA